MFQKFVVSALPILMILAAALDLVSLRIPNWLNLLLAALFFPAAWLVSMSGNEVMWHLVAGFGMLVIGYTCFALGFFGGGDAKLIAAAGLWFGTAYTLPFLFYAVMAGGVLAAIVAGMSILGVELEAKHTKIFEHYQKLKPKVPYGIALAVGAIMAIPETPWISHMA